MEGIFNNMKDGGDAVSFALDTKIAAVRDQSALWMVAAWKELAARRDMIKNAWQGQARLLDAWQNSVQTAAMARMDVLFNGEYGDIEEDAMDTPDPEDDPELDKLLIDRLLKLQTCGDAWLSEDGEVGDDGMGASNVVDGSVEAQEGGDENTNAGSAVSGLGAGFDEMHAGSSEAGPSSGIGYDYLRASFNEAGPSGVHDTGKSAGLVPKQEALDAEFKAQVDAGIEWFDLFYYWGHAKDE
eukprot:scaffold177385_cov19-Tisochrysis_lutea.AAC.1